jgi:hypothetical protein
MYGPPARYEHILAQEGLSSISQDALSLLTIEQIGSVASGERTDRKKAKGLSIAAAGKARRTTHLIPLREDEPHARMGMSCSPEILPEMVLTVAGVCFEQREDACSADLDGGDDDQDDASYQARLRAHIAPFTTVLLLAWTSPTANLRPR